MTPNESLAQDAGRPAAPAEAASPQARDGWLRRFAGGWIRLLSALGVTVSRDDVIWCFRHLLGREPESERTLLAHCRFFSFRALVLHIAASAEYAGTRHAIAAAPLADAGPGAIGAAAFRAAVDAYLQKQPASPGVREYVDMHSPRLLDTLNIVRRVLPDGGHVLDYSAVGFFSHAMQALVHGVRQVNVGGVNFELDDYAERYGIGRYDLCLNTEVIEHLIFDPARMVHQINRMLRPGGHLLMSTPNAISAGNAVRLLTGNPPSVWNQVNAVSSHYFDRHNRDWTPFELSRLVEEHGFEVLELSTRDYYQDTRRLLSLRPALHRLVLEHSTHSLHGDTQLLLARKVRESTAPVRKPWLYYLPPATADDTVRSTGQHPPCQA